MSDSKSIGIKFGLTRLILINSGTYLEGHIPLDAAVSFCGPNNFGKSTGINALQFLLIPDINNSAASDRVSKQSELAARFFAVIHNFQLVLDIFSNDFFASIANRFYKVTLSPQLTTPKVLFLNLRM